MRWAVDATRSRLLGLWWNLTSPHAYPPLCWQLGHTDEEFKCNRKGVSSGTLTSKVIVLTVTRWTPARHGCTEFRSGGKDVSIAICAFWQR